MNSQTTNRPHLRQKIRSLRKDLPDNRKNIDDKLIREHIKTFLQYSKPTSIGLYHPVDGEPDLLPLITYLRLQQYQLALPRIDLKVEGLMQFYNWPESINLHANRFGIEEPPEVAGSSNNLDIILAPLVVFSNNGTRLGIGSGYYDRWLATQSPRPLLVGIAYEFQRVDHLLAQPWDIPLNMVITEAGEFSFPKIECDNAE